MSFLRHRRSIVRWEFEVGPGANQAAAPLPPSHRLNESRPVIPWQVALQQSLPPLHQPVSSSPQSAGNCKPPSHRGGGIFNRHYAEFSAGIDNRAQMPDGHPDSSTTHRVLPRHDHRFLRRLQKRSRSFASVESLVRSGLQPPPSEKAKPACHPLNRGPRRTHRR